MSFIFCVLDGWFSSSLYVNLGLNLCHFFIFSLNFYVEHETATRVKDALREFDINQLVQIWFQILQQMHEKQAKLAQHCLQVIDRYINWMPLELVVNDEFMNLFFNFLNVQALQNETVDCLYEITKKSMPASKKMELIKGTNLIQVLSQCEAHEKSTEFAVKVAGLLGKRFYLFNIYRKDTLFISCRLCSVQK